MINREKVIERLNRAIGKYEYLMDQEVEHEEKWVNERVVPSYTANDIYLLLEEIYRGYNVEKDSDRYRDEISSSYEDDYEDDRLKER